MDGAEYDAQSHSPLLVIANSWILRLCDRSLDSRTGMVFSWRSRLHRGGVCPDSLPASDLPQGLGKVAVGVADRIDRALLLDTHGLSVVAHKYGDLPAAWLAGAHTTSYPPVSSADVKRNANASQTISLPLVERALFRNQILASVARETTTSLTRGSAGERGRITDAAISAQPAFPFQRAQFGERADP